MNELAKSPPNGVPALASREFEIALALAYSRLEPRRRLGLAPLLLEAFARRAETLRAALAPPTAGEAFAEGAARDRLQDLPESFSAQPGRLPAFAVALALEDLAAGAAGDVHRLAEDRDAPFHAELFRLHAILAAARLPAPPPRPPAAERQRQADALRRAFGLRPRNADDRAA